MFALIESKAEIAKAQRKLEASFRKAFRQQATRNIGYPGGTTTGAKVVTNGKYWYWSADLDIPQSPNPRRLNWFGVFDNDHDLQISVEINTPFVRCEWTDRRFFCSGQWERLDLSLSLRPSRRWNFWR